MATARAPGVVKLLGEHAVLYGETSLAVAVGLYAKAELRQNGNSGLRVVLKDLAYSHEFRPEELRQASNAYRKASGSDRELREFLDANANGNRKALPYAIIAGRMQEDYGTDLKGLEITITSEIPRSSGCASSAACFTAFTSVLASVLASRLGERISDAELIDIAREGERVTHRMVKAGGIDVSTSYLGGFVTSGDGKHKRLDIKLDLPLLLINTGPKRETWEMVEYVGRQKAEEPERVDAIIKEVGQRSLVGISALLRGDIPTLGAEMTRTHGAFKRLDVSNARLDQAVEIALENQAYGAKLSGGGGGGIAVALVNEGPVDQELRDKGFEVLRPRIADAGAKELA